ncbi:hypothetical protein BT96DRAFT_980180 [Gymnopus androsaceus JB14]|uniref:Uncharacterized protein n=1 Tax=Gymnopus androsaceus JB14 TaxID=1447944 RepID=A0A6A4GZT0_9AGAR|nr:hypothetical protein BT96DRAFT_980180 [Gymnopus androsaceus JB14]
MSDFVVWSAFFWQFPGLDKARSKFNSVKPVVDFFPGKKVVFGEAACERVQLPLPPCLDMTDYSTLNENEFVTRCIVELVRTAEAMQKNETLVILLIGHGGLSNKRFQFFITHGYGISGPAWITKRGLEDALERCVANIVVVCNSCHSGALKSPLWTLLCAAGPLERSDALTPSQSGLTVPEGGVSVETLVEDSEEGFPMDMVLSLAREFSRVSQSLFTYEGRMADRCIKFMGSNDRSTEVAKDLLYDLYNRHVQATVVQELARRLGWWTGETVPFFFVIQEAIHEDHQTTMVHAGIPVDEMLWNLLPFYPGIFGVIDRASHYWLASKWVEAGSPTMTLEEWDEAVVTAAKEVGTKPGLKYAP